MKTIRVILTFPPDTIEQPVTCLLIRRFDIMVNILRASVNPGEEGLLLLEIEGQPTDLESALAYVREQGVGVLPLEQRILIDREGCVDCGACIAACAPGALGLDPDYRLAFDVGRCVACGLCQQACPLGSITVVFRD